jgi:hypothetical protein
MDNVFLEGTGALVLDHVERVAYAAKSNRTDAIMLERFCTHFNFEPMVFEATDAKGRPIYHTNALMGIGTQFCMIGLATISDPGRRIEIQERLENTGRRVVDLTRGQIANFAGNTIELFGKNSPVLALSAQALKALHPKQIAALEQFTDMLPLDVPTIDLAGGSVRCMPAAFISRHEPVSPLDFEPAREHRRD